MDSFSVDIAPRRVMILKQKRSCLEVAADILRIRGSQTAIMYGANLSYTQTQTYLRELTDQGLIEPVVGGSNGRRQYGPTLKGQEFIELVEKLETLLGS